MSRALLLIGTGLIGGSFALAARSANLFDRVIGVDRSADALAEARKARVIDEAAGDINEIPADEIGAVCVAVPVATITDQVRAAAELVPPNVPIFDVGSVKAAVLDGFDAPPPNFVPCHPIAGSEKQGPSAARGDLFRGHLVVLTPTVQTDAGIIAEVESYWRAVGARVLFEEAAEHDRHLAITSHLPHLVAFAMLELARGGEAFEHAGSGFRDFTRLAGSDAEVWTSILHGNRDLVVEHLDQLIDILRSFADMLESPDQLHERIEAVSRLRKTLDSPA